jgi:predicted Zn-dependent protease with MMP-like domain
VLEHLGEGERAQASFERAAELQPELYPQPVRIEAALFEQAAAEAVGSLPESVRQYVANCPILIEDLPSRELLLDENLSPQILGLFQGTPATEPEASPTLGSAPGTGLDRILLFKGNLEKVARSHDELVEQIQITVKHEIGHYLGLEEDDLERLGLG